MAPEPRAQYLSKMPTRIVLLLALLALVSCATTEPDPALSTTEQGLSCGLTQYFCDPMNSWSGWECEGICGGFPGAGHCKGYTAYEVAWCANHPDQFFSPYQFCSPSGNPLWRTWCVKGPVP